MLVTLEAPSPACHDLRQKEERKSRHATSPTSKCGREFSESEAERFRELLTLIRGVTEHHRAGSRTLEVQVRRMLPSEAHAAVNLNVFRGGVKESLGAV